MRICNFQLFKWTVKKSLARIFYTSQSFNKLILCTWCWVEWNYSPILIPFRLYQQDSKYKENTRSRSQECLESIPHQTRLINYPFSEENNLLNKWSSAKRDIRKKNRARVGQCMSERRNVQNIKCTHKMHIKMFMWLTYFMHQ